MAHCLAHVDPGPDAALDLLREGLRLIRSLKRFARQLSEPRGEPRRGLGGPPRVLSGGHTFPLRDGQSQKEKRRKMVDVGYLMWISSHKNDNLMGCMMYI